MHRIDAADNASNRFSNGDASIGVNGTTVDADWLNAVQEGIALFIEAAGITLAKGDNTQLQDAVAAFIATHNAVTSPHSATALATAARLVLRDAAGRAAFADPAAAGDAATKGYVDGKFPAVVWTGITVESSATPGAGGQAPAYWKDPCGVVHLRGVVTLTTGNNGICTTTPIPAGVRPGMLRDLVVADWTNNAAQVLVLGSDGTLALKNAVSATTLVSLDGVSYVAEP